MPWLSLVLCSGQLFHLLVLFPMAGSLDDPAKNLFREISHGRDPKRNVGFGRLGYSVIDAGGGLAN